MSCGQVSSRQSSTAIAKNAGWASSGSWGPLTPLHLRPRMIQWFFRQFISRSNNKPADALWILPKASTAT